MFGDSGIRMVEPKTTPQSPSIEYGYPPIPFAFSSRGSPVFDTLQQTGTVSERGYGVELMSRALWMAA